MIHWFGKSAAYLDNFISVQFDRVRGQSILGGLRGPEHNTGTPLRLSHTILSFYCLLLQSPITYQGSNATGNQFRYSFFIFPFERFSCRSSFHDECYFISQWSYLSTYGLQSHIHCEDVLKEWISVGPGGSVGSNPAY